MPPKAADPDFAIDIDSMQKANLVSKRWNKLMDDLLRWSCDHSPTGSIRLTRFRSDGSEGKVSISSMDLYVGIPDEDLWRYPGPHLQPGKPQEHDIPRCDFCHGETYALHCRRCEITLCRNCIATGRKCMCFLPPRTISSSNPCPNCYPLTMLG